MSLLYTAPIVKVLLFMSFIDGERIAQLRLGKHRQGNVGKHRIYPEICCFKSKIESCCLKLSGVFSLNRLSVANLKIYECRGFNLQISQKSGVTYR